MLQLDEGKIKSKFLVLFLHRKPVLKCLWKDLLLSSIPNEDGIPEGNEVTSLIIQFIAMLLNSRDISEKRSLSKMMYWFQIASMCEFRYFGLILPI